MEKLVGDSVAGPRETELPQLFCCRLEEQPDHLVAGRYLNFDFKSDVQLFVNSECVFTRDGELPGQFSGTPWLFSNFAPGIANFQIFLGISTATLAEVDEIGTENTGLEAAAGC
jgi:hypothetical protein